jgi:uncharacterized protein DUF955
MNTARLATQAVRSAALIRSRCGIGPGKAVCPFDVAEQLGVVVRLVGLPSLEGIYSPNPKPTIVVNAERPAGRRRYTCGHELGHHVFGHGERIDEIVDVPRQSTPEEFLAQRFSGALLMPKFAVEAAFTRRRWPFASPTPEQVFVVAQDLGVGYSTLIVHMEATLRIMPSSIAKALSRASLQKIRLKFAGIQIPNDLVVVDEQWGARPVDIEVDDCVLVPWASAINGMNAVALDRSFACWQIRSPGIGSITLASNNKVVTIRVSRRKFTGLARYRHLEESTDD